MPATDFASPRSETPTSPGTSFGYSNANESKMNEPDIESKMNEPDIRRLSMTHNPVKNKYQRGPDGLFHCPDPDCDYDHIRASAIGRHFAAKHDPNFKIKPHKPHQFKPKPDPRGNYATGNHPCFICGEVLANSSKLGAHMRRLHPNTPTRKQREQLAAKPNGGLTQQLTSSLGEIDALCYFLAGQVFQMATAAADSAGVSRQYVFTKVGGLVMRYGKGESDDPTRQAVHHGRHNS
jgi:hypothetical protein